MRPNEEHEASHGLEEHDEVGVGDVGGEDGGDDGSNLDTSSIVVSVGQVVVDLRNEVAKVEGLDTLSHGVHEVSNATAGVVGDLVGDLRPVGNDGVETAELHGISH